MNHLIRASVFETNSSSTHAVSVSKNTKYLHNPYADATVILLETGEFGWERETYNDYHNKLSYLVTGIIQKFVDWDTPFDNTIADSDPDMDLLKEAISEFTGVSKFEYGIMDGLIDHQSNHIPQDIINDGKDAIINFIFNPESRLITANDNSYDYEELDEMFAGCDYK